MDPWLIFCVSGLISGTGAALFYLKGKKPRSGMVYPTFGFGAILGLAITMILWYFLGDSEKGQYAAVAIAAFINLGIISLSAIRQLVIGWLKNMAQFLEKAENGKRDPRPDPDSDA